MLKPRPKAGATTREAIAAQELSAPMDRLWSVLDLAIQMGMVSVADVVHLLEIPRPTAHRLIANLEALGFLQRMPMRGKYTASLKLVTFAKSVLSSTMVYAPMRAMLETLSKKTGETHNISVMSMGELQFVASVEGSVAVAQVQTGHTAPLHATGSGQTLLAYADDDLLNQYLQAGPWASYTAYTITRPEDLRVRLLDIRARDFNVIDSEYVIGTIGIAIPIRSARTNKVVAALGCMTSNQRYNVKTAESIVDAMRPFAERITRLL